mgnify:FL=1
MSQRAVETWHTKMAHKQKPPGEAGGGSGTRAVLGKGKEEGLPLPKTQ